MPEIFKKVQDFCKNLDLRVHPLPFIRKILKRPASETFLTWDNFAKPISAILRNFKIFLSPAIFSYSSVLDFTEIDPDFFAYFTCCPNASSFFFPSFARKEILKNSLRCGRQCQFGFVFLKEGNRFKNSLWILNRFTCRPTASQFFFLCASRETISKTFSALRALIASLA